MINVNFMDPTEEFERLKGVADHSFSTLRVEDTRDGPR